MSGCEWMTRSWLITFRRWAGETKLIPGPGCCCCIADCHRDPCSDLFGQLNITVVETLRPQYYRQSGWRCDRVRRMPASALIMTD